MNEHKSARGHGFTLIELLVAISVMAIVAVLGWRGLDSIVRARVSLNNDLEHTRGLQLAFAQMQSDCARIASSDVVGRLGPLDVQPGKLTLIRMSYAENQPTRAQVVAYRLRDGVLMRRESPAIRDLNELTVAWTAALADSDVSPPVALHAGVSTMSMRVWDANTKTWRVGMTGSQTPAALPAQSLQTPQSPQTPSIVSQNAVQKTTGLEVALRLREQDIDLVKIFLLGPV